MMRIPTVRTGDHPPFNLNASRIRQFLAGEVPGFLLPVPGSVKRTAWYSYALPPTLRVTFVTAAMSSSCVLLRFDDFYSGKIRRIPFRVAGEDFHTLHGCMRANIEVW